MGFGNVGSAFFRLVHEKKELCQRRYGLDLRFQAVFELGGAFLPPENILSEEILEKYSTHSFLSKSPHWKPGLSLQDLLGSYEPGVLVECTPSNIKDGKPGLSHIRQAIDRGWHVATANKGPLIVDFRGLKMRAKKNDVVIKFSGATAAALPTLDIGLYSLAGTEISQIDGILNGTTNYILTKMREGISYQDALKYAQDKGIAEADPSLDVNGWDTALKILLISNAVLDTNFSIEDVKVEGITDIPQTLFHQGRKEGRALKLLGKLYKKNEDYIINVALEIIEKSHPLFGVDGTNKGITFFTDTMSSITVFGGKSDPRGAGAALLKDIINIYS